MTLYQYAVDYLQQNGLFQSQAESVMIMATGDPAFECFAGRWNDDISGYPEALLAILRVSAGLLAVRWSDDNLPRAWWRTVFHIKESA